jgi:hypothetical protein
MTLLSVLIEIVIRMYRFFSALAKPTISAQKEGKRLQIIKD